MKMTVDDLARFAMFGVFAGVLLAPTGCAGVRDAEVVEVSEGQGLYDENCGTCHGEHGLGDGPMAASLPIQPPSLMDHLGHHASDQLIRIIRTGLPPAMPPAPLSEDEVRLVIDYAWTLVPDSLVAELRAMQRMAEMGMEMDMDASGTMQPMNGDSSGHVTPSDTARR